MKNAALPLLPTPCSPLLPPSPPARTPRSPLCVHSWRRPRPRWSRCRRSWSRRRQLLRCKALLGLERVHGMQLGCLHGTLCTRRPLTARAVTPATARSLTAGRRGCCCCCGGRRCDERLAGVSAGGRAAALQGAGEEVCCGTQEDSGGRALPVNWRCGAVNSVEWTLQG